VKQFLEQDVKDKKNEQMTPAVLRMMQDAYIIFRLDIFGSASTKKFVIKNSYSILN
jgi:hypothetical protein